MEEGKGRGVGGMKEREEWRKGGKEGPVPPPRLGTRTKNCLHFSTLSETIYSTGVGPHLFIYLFVVLFIYVYVFTPFSIIYLYIYLFIHPPLSKETKRLSTF